MSGLAFLLTFWIELCWSVVWLVFEGLSARKQMSVVVQLPLQQGQRLVALPRAIFFRSIVQVSYKSTSTMLVCVGNKGNGTSFELRLPNHNDNQHCLYKITMLHQSKKQKTKHTNTITLDVWCWLFGNFHLPYQISVCLYKIPDVF